jgi:hypothetical protein
MTYTLNFRHGMGAAARAFNRGDLGAIFTFAEHANSVDPAVRAAGREALIGATVFLVELLHVLQRKRAIVLKGEPLPTSDDLVYAINCDVARFSALCQMVLDTSGKIFRAFPVGTLRAWISYEPAQTTASEERPPVPMPVHIVSMPDRRTTTLITRDGEGDIVASQQVETDAFASAVA